MRKVITATLIIMMLGVVGAGAVSFLPVFMKDVFQKADRVAVGRIIQMEEVYSAINSKLGCGWQIDFEVIRSLKGGTDTFSFFTTDKDTLYEDADEYLIVASQNNHFSKEGRQGTIYCNPYAGLMGEPTANANYVNVSSYRYVANSSWDSGHVAIMPLDTLAQVEYGGQWVRVPGHYNVRTIALRRAISVDRDDHGLAGYDTVIFINLKELLEEAFGELANK